MTSEQLQEAVFNALEDTTTAAGALLVRRLEQALAQRNQVELRTQLSADLAAAVKASLEAVTGPAGAGGPSSGGPSVTPRRASESPGAAEAKSLAAAARQTAKAALVVAFCELGLFFSQSTDHPAVSARNAAFDKRLIPAGTDTIDQYLSVSASWGACGEGRAYGV
jgi:hypothetical protein